MNPSVPRLTPRISVPASQPRAPPKAASRRRRAPEPDLATAWPSRRGITSGRKVGCAFLVHHHRVVALLQPFFERRQYFAHSGRPGFEMMATVFWPRLGLWGRLGHVSGLLRSADCFRRSLLTSNFRLYRITGWPGGENSACSRNSRLPSPPRMGDSIHSARASEF
jgi:hypothetical protein